MAGRNYTAWEGGSEFVDSLRANRAQLEAFMAQQSPGDRRRMAEGLAEYLAQAIQRDPNALPMGLSETLDAVRSGQSKDGKLVGSLKGIKNDFYNLFDKHPNLMLTTGGVIGLGGGLSLFKHFGLDLGTPGGVLTAIGTAIFQTEKLVTLSTGPARRQMDARDDSLSGQLAQALETKMPEAEALAARIPGAQIPDATVPQGMDPNSPTGRMVKESGGAMSRAFREMVKHREMVIGNILVLGETFQTGGFVTEAYLDKANIAKKSALDQKKSRRTANFGMVNAVSNTMLMGLTYYNQYIDPKLQELDKNSPTYQEDKAKIWAEAPKEHIFKPGRACARLIAGAPDKVRGWMPNMAIAASFLPLIGMAMQGWGGMDKATGQRTAMQPWLFYGTLAVMANVLLNYTAITNRSKGQKVPSPEEAESFVDVVAGAAKQQLQNGAAMPDAGKAGKEINALKDMLLSQSFIPREYEGLVEQRLNQAFGMPFVAVRDHSRPLPLSREPMVLPESHRLTEAVKSLGATEADITPEGASLRFKDAPQATQLAVDTINELVKSGSHIAKSLGGIQIQHAPDGKVAEMLATEQGTGTPDKTQLAVKVQQTLQAMPPAANLAPQVGQQMAAMRH